MRKEIEKRMEAKEIKETDEERRRADFKVPHFTEAPQISFLFVC